MTVGGVTVGGVTVGGVTVVVAVAELFVVVGSGVDEETVAVFEMFTVVVAAVMVTVALAPLASDPRSQ